MPFFTGISGALTGQGGFGFSRRARIKRKVPFAQYLFTGAQQTSIYIPQNATELVFAGVAMGGRGLTTNSIPADPAVNNGGGGGAGNLQGFPVPVNGITGQDLYIGVGGPSIVIDTYAKTGSHTGTTVFVLGRGSPGDAGSTGGDGGSFGTPGANGGGNATNSGAGGGNSRNASDASLPPEAFLGGNGGTTTQSGLLLEPINVGPTPSWTWNGPQSGGAGAPGAALYNGGSSSSESASGSGTACYGPNVSSVPGSPRNNNLKTAVGSGGGGGGVMINGTGYGGGGGAKGGGGGWGTYTGPNVGGPGGPGFLIVQIYELQ